MRRSEQSGAPGCRAKVDATKTNVLVPCVLGRYPSDPRDVLLEQLGVWVTEGCAGTDPQSSAHRIDIPIVSGSFMRPGNRAWRVEHSHGQWVAWKTAAVPAGMDEKAEPVFVFTMAMGLGSMVREDPAHFELQANGQPVVRFLLVKHSEVWRSARGSFCFQVKKIHTAQPGVGLAIDGATRDESLAVYGLGILGLPAGFVPPGEAVTIRVEPSGNGSGRKWFRLDETSSKKSPDEHYGTLPEKDYWRGLLMISGRGERPRVGAYNVYFGDLHTHSGESDAPGKAGCGKGTVEENYAYARDVSNLDFYSLSDHEWQMPDSKGWDRRQELAEKYNEKGRFATLLAYEWGLEFGQRCVYYEKGGQPMFAHRGDAHTPKDLWARLGGLESRALTIPHHTAWTKTPFEYESSNPGFDRLVEVYSCTGNSEYEGASLAGHHEKFSGFYVRDMLDRGLRTGIIASSDGHDGCAGRATGTAAGVGSGRAAVLARELTRDAVFDALWHRRAYGTTGEPIVVDFRVNGEIMGSEIKTGKLRQQPEILAEARGTHRIRRVCVIRNGHVLEEMPCDREAGSWTFKDEEYRGGPAYYYVRVEQEDGEMAWSSPVWLV